MGKVHKISRSEHAIASKLKLLKICVHNTITRYKETRFNQDCSRSGRLRATTYSEEKFIINTCKQNRHLTAPQIHPEVNKSQSKPVSLTTVKRQLRDAKLFGRIVVR